MGIGPFSASSSSSYDRPNPMAPLVVAAGNPDPANFKIISSQMVLGHVVVLVHYPDARNYEGRKIMLYLNCKLSDLRKQKTLDPHFSKNKKYLSPFARFEPTDLGWNAAILLAQAIG